MSEIGQMTLHDVRRLSGYMKVNPSTRQLVAACASALGVKLPEPQEDKPQRYMSFEQAKAWAAAANSAMVNPNG